MSAQAASLPELQLAYGMAAALAASRVRTRDGKAWHAMAIKRISDRAARPGES